MLKIYEIGNVNNYEIRRFGKIGRWNIFVKNLEKKMEIIKREKHELSVKVIFTYRERLLIILKEKEVIETVNIEVQYPRMLTL